MVVFAIKPNEGDGKNFDDGEGRYFDDGEGMYFEGVPAFGLLLSGVELACLGL